MSYLDRGYDQFLSKNPYPSSNLGIDPLEEDLNTSEISASKIQGGIMQSQNGRSQLNLESGYFVVNDGATQIVRLGVQEDGSIGIVIKDRDGHELMRFVGDVNVLKSPDGNMELNFNNTQLIIKDEGGLPRVLLGRLP